MSDLITFDDCQHLEIGRIHELYGKHVSRSQVALIGSFGFGRDLVDHAEGPGSTCVTAGGSWTSPAASGS